MKIGIIGTGAVGSACALSVTLRGAARELVLIDRTEARARAVATDIRYGTTIGPRITVHHGHYADLAGAGIVMVTAGVNEKTGGATDRNDPEGRLKLLKTNVAVYREIIPQIVAAAPEAVILVVTDPPDPLADLARALARHDRVLSTGTFLDSQRLRTHIAAQLGVDPASVEAQVLGEHGTSQVFMWSTARVAGIPLADVLAQRKITADAFRREVDHAVRYANITIIEGNNASQYGIGMLSARIAEMVLRDERAVIPIGCFNPRYGVTFSTPAVVGRAGAMEVLDPAMSEEERAGLEKSAATLKQALARALDESGSGKAAG